MQSIKISVLLKIILITVFSTSNIYAEPPFIQSVSGEIKDGQQLIISGSKFGTKKNASPLLWDNFEGGSASKNWTDLNNLWNIYSGTGQLNNSKYCVRADRSLASSIPMMLKNDINDKLYVFVKRRWDFELLTRNQKFFRIWQSTGSENIVWAYNDGNKYVMRSDGTAPSVNPDNPLPKQTIALAQDDFPQVGKWHLDEFFLKLESASGKLDGITAYRKNNIDHRSWANNRGTIGTGINYPYSKIFIDNYGECYGGGHSCLNSGSYIWVDDVYIDNTWARVVIGNYKNYDNCTQIEIQPTTAWDNVNGKIQITLNKGAFSTLTGKYLFVFNEINECSNSFKLGEQGFDFRREN